jgi:MFS family permease
MEVYRALHVLARIDSARPPTACYSREIMTNRSLFYGWWIVAAFSVTTFMSTGVRHAVGPFLKPIVADLGIDRASFSIVIALSLFLYGLFMPIAGMALDRFSVRVVTSAGTILLVLSLVLTAMVRNFWEFAAVYGVLVPLGLAGTGPVIASGVVARWFNKRRGTALSVLGSASMTGMSLLVPAITWLILTRGWRMTYVVIGAIILVVVMPLCLWVFRDSPESIGLMADGAPAKPGATTGPVERVTAREALQTLAFWQLACSFFTCGFSMSLLSAHGIPMLTDHGYSPMFASWAMGVLGGSSIGFTVMLGALSDRLGRRPVLASIYAGRVLIFTGFFLIRDNPVALLAVAVVGGITMAGTGSMTSALTADIYGRFSVSSVFGLIFLVHQTGSALGSSLAGVLFETTGGYGAAYAVACALLVGASILALNIDKGARRIWRAATASATN